MMCDYPLTTIDELIEWHTARWSDESYPDKPFGVEICRLDKPEANEKFEALTELEKEQFDDSVFFYVNTVEEFENLYDPDNGLDFYLIKKSEVN
jgi:hypothetical protein